MGEGPGVREGPGVGDDTSTAPSGEGCRRDARRGASCLPDVEEDGEQRRKGGGEGIGGQDQMQEGVTGEG